MRLDMVFGPNPYGIFAVHDVTLCPTDFNMILEGPIAAAEPKLLEEISKPTETTQTTNKQ